MQPFLLSLVSVSFAAAMLVPAAASKASATAAQPESVPAPVDVMDFYLGVVNANNCCDCHSAVC